MKRAARTAHPAELFAAQEIARSAAPNAATEPLPPAPAAVAAEVNAQSSTAAPRQQAEQYAEQLYGAGPERALLEEVRAWLAADEERMAWFRHCAFRYWPMPRELKITAAPFGDEAPAAAAAAPAMRSLRAAAQALHSPLIPTGKLTTLAAAARARAFGWLCQIEAGTTTLQQIYPWLENQPLLFCEYERLALLWEQLRRQQLQKLIAGMPTAPLPALESLTPERLAVLAAEEHAPAMLLRQLLYRHCCEWREFVTAVGERCSRQLESFDVLTLNTASRVRVKLGAARREIELLQGELLCTSATELAWPLTLRCERIAVDFERAICGVRRFSAEVLEVYVITGVVAVRTLTGPPLVAHAPAEGVLVRNGQRLRVAADTVQVWTLNAAIADYCIWLIDQIELRDTPLGALVEECNRYRKGPRLVADARVRDILLNGLFATHDEHQLVTLLQAHGLRTQIDSLAGEMVLRVL